MLAAAVIRSGIDATDGEWLRGECGRWWIGLTGLTPEAVWRAYHRAQQRKVIPQYIKNECDHGRVRMVVTYERVVA